MQADGVIRCYAIGGAVGATFYLEPVATMDVDVFVSFQAEAGSLLVSPQPIFDYLKMRGGVMEGEYIVVAGWPVQFLPTATPLFVGLLVGVVILVGALTFVPALALGPIVEHLTLIAAK